MDLNRWRVALIGLFLLAACGDDAEGGGLPGNPVPPAGSAVPGAPLPDGGVSTVTAAPTTQPDSALPASPAATHDSGVAPTSDANVAAAEAGTSSTQSDAGSASGDAAQPATPQPFDYMMQEVALMADLVIPKGKTVRVGPGSKFSAKGANVKISVQGTLVVEGSAAAPASFLGNGQSESWLGIVIESGGSVSVDQAKIGNAKYGIHALSGSSFTVEHATFDTSFKGAVLEANGSIAHSVFKAELLFPAVTEDVSIDDPNGYLTIINASPTITNSRFEGSGGLNDMVRIGGNASPKFDHCFVSNSHCGFHTAGGTNTSARISNTVFESLSYGVMAYTTKPIVENSVFRRNGADIGMCSGATSANTPVLMGNFYEAGAVSLDASCDKIGTKDASPATSAGAGVGPSGL